ncbi:Sporulation protein YtrH [Moorella glycerini]|uniref:Sporulation membrane protein YtrH n=1 Tax=Neomoorella stamsii TaxID=1266720 RepID=A0A9X7J545_9FIRM|nr:MULTISPECIES: YtrH family sporulation protein [Moorella]PRR77362.1 Sporulation membrane protein YtrH [Moorella stamsii]CEP65995.1 Sporulation protein YtrH [Moorella glycerini]
MDGFFPKLLLIFFTALGVVLGAAVVGSLAAVLVGQPPLRTMTRLALEIKIWAIAAAMGGTFSAIEILGQGLLEGQFRVLAKQLLFIIVAFIGAQVGYWLIQNLAGGK